MATSFLNLSGTVKWAKVFKPDEKYENWSVCLYPDKASLDAFMKSGLQTKFKEDEDGRFLTFRRPTKKQFGKDEVVFEPPGVWKDGAAFKEPIGNGSKCTLKIEMYDTAKGKGSRLDGLRIDEFVKYEGGGIEGQAKRIAMPF